MKIKELTERVHAHVCVRLQYVVGSEYALDQLVQRYMDDLSDHLNTIGNEDWALTDVNQWTYYMLDTGDGLPIPVYTGDTVTLWNDLYLDERTLVGDDPMELSDIYRVSDVMDYELAILNSFILNEIEYAAGYAVESFLSNRRIEQYLESKGENNV